MQPCFFFSVLRAPSGILLSIAPFGLQRPCFGILLLNIFYVGIDCLSSDIYICCLPHCLFSYPVRFNLLGFLPFSFHLLFTVLISVILLVYSVIFATLILHSCRLRFGTTFLLSCTFCHLLLRNHQHLNLI